MRFRILGQLEVCDGDGKPIPLRAPKQRALLTVLLLHAGQPVSAGRLEEAIWRGNPPPSAPGVLRTYASGLRQTLRLERATLPWLSREPTGYRLTLAPGDLDLAVFEDLSSRGRRALGSSNPAEAARLLSEALALWRGEPAGDITLDKDSEGIVASLAERRLATEEAWADAHLALGNGTDLVGRLRTLAAKHPLREGVRGQLMVALYRAGRTAEALEEFRELRRTMAGDLGIEPSLPIQTLHRRILAGDPALVSASSAVVTPRQLPSASTLFTGRTDELAQLNAALREHGGLSAIGGTAGIGKTALALRWAHLNVERFPDGQLWVDLRGFDPSEEPVPAPAAIRWFLNALGVEPGAMPADPEAQAGLYRSLLAGKRMLVVLDNARDTGQVIPLLPGSAARCAVLVTSRRQLTGLVAAHGARLVDLDLLSEGEARDLLGRTVGPARLAAEPDAAASLLASCAGLPLAIRIVAARAIEHPAFPLAGLADELTESATRLDALDTSDSTTSVRAVFSWSYQALAPAVATAFGLIGLAPGPDISLPATASLTALPVPRAQAVLHDLDAVSLLQQHVPGRYRMHDLVRQYAAERASLDQVPEDLATALRRVTGFYEHNADAADRLLAPHRNRAWMDGPTADCVVGEFPDVGAAVAWFRSEHACLLACQRLAVTRQWHTQVWQLAWSLNTFHLWHGHTRDQIATWQAALTAAIKLGEPSMVASARRWLGNGLSKAGRHAEALGQLRKAITLAAGEGDIAGQAHMNLTLSGVWERLDRHSEALDHAVRSLHLFRTLGNPIWEAQALNGVGWQQAHIGHLDQARTSCEAALSLNRQHGYRLGESAALDSLGFIAFRAGEYARAIDFYSRAAAGWQELGHLADTADALDCLATTHDARGERDEARRVWRQALALYRGQHRAADAARVERQLAHHAHRENDPFSRSGP